jgi:hypothetical protein
MPGQRSHLSGKIAALFIARHQPAVEKPKEIIQLVLLLQQIHAHFEKCQLKCQMKCQFYSGILGVPATYLDEKSLKKF